MTQIIDVSPTRLNTSTTDPNHSVIGRTLSINCSPDGQNLFAGSYSNLWMSGDSGQNWEQTLWQQPDFGQFTVGGSLGGWCVVDIVSALGWRVDKHPRFLAQLRRPRRRPRQKTLLDIVGFGDCGVWTALGNGDGTFQPPNVVIANFGYQAGGWQVDRHPRFAVDLTGDGRADIIGFGDAGVWTAIGNGDGTFQAPQFVLGNYGYQQDWRVDRHPRFLAHLTNSGFADIVGFGEDGVWIALGNGDGTFSEPLKNPVLHNFAHHQGWQVDRNPRFLARLTDSGFDDIVAFGDDGVWTALSNGDGSFRMTRSGPVLSAFGYNQGWREDQHVRLMANLTSSGFADIVGFGEERVFTALSKGDGTFNQVTTGPVLHNFCYNQGWRVDTHPRFLGNLTASGFADIVGFGDAGVWTAKGNGDGTFQDANFVLANFGVEQGWRVDRHPRFVANLSSSGHADIVGIGDAGVWTAIGDGNGGFPTSNFVLANFGYGLTVIAIVISDLATGTRGIWRSTDWGANWAQVHQFPTGEIAGQLEWALGSDHLVYAAGGSSLAISKNGGTTFQDVFPWANGTPARANHVALWQNLPADPYPAIIYVLGDSTMFVSFDGGTTWIADKGTVPANVGGAVSPTTNSNSPRVMVIAPNWPLEVYVAGNGSGGDTAAVLHRGNYAQFFFGNQTSSWEDVPLPDFLTVTGQDSHQDNGNVFLVATQRGRGDLLYYGAQRSVVFVGPLYPATGTDWIQLDAHVHADLHGFLLSPDFSAAIIDGVYQPRTGRVWLLSDGGIYQSNNGGQTLVPSQTGMTLSVVNVGGVSAPGQGPALSLNNGDNDGFYSMDGGQTWTYQEYGGGDNDCSFADPLHSNLMMVFTPRWDVTGKLADHTRDGQTVAVYASALGTIPNVAITADQRVVPGPPLLPDSETFRDLWNANSFYGSRGSRPVVRGLPTEGLFIQGDYIFILDPTENPVLVRTQQILEIADRSEWITTATAPNQGPRVYLQGPPLPFGGLGVVQASGGHAATVFYVGGDLSGSLWTWTAGSANWTQIVPAPPIPNSSVGANSATRFFVDPYRPNVIYILDAPNIKRSDDGGKTWNIDVSLETQLTWNYQIPITSDDDSIGLGDHFDLVLTDMQFDPTNPGIRFAVGNGGVFLTIDAVNWTCLLNTGAMAGRPTNCFYDWISDPYSPSIYVGFAGRSVVKITDLLLNPIF